MWAVVPLKHAAAAKSRLKDVLSAAERETLFFSMARRVIGALRATPAISHVLVVTADPVVARFAESQGATVLRQAVDEGTASACTLALQRLAERGEQRALISSGDLPNATAGAFESLLRTASADTILIQPDRHRQGTNVLVCPPAMPMRFGPDSYQQHLHVAEQMQIATRSSSLRELALDVDCADDYAIWRTSLASMSVADALALTEVEDWRELAGKARALRDAGWGRSISYSRKVFIPLTHLCRDVCHYCTFAKTPRSTVSPYLSIDQVVEIARAGAAVGCKEALFTLGDQPEARYSSARNALAQMGYESTSQYLEAAARRVLDETGLLPHLNPGLLRAEDYVRLRPVAGSMGLMLESSSTRLCERGGAHYGSPDKHPDVRLESLRLAGEARVPTTSGILIGIGETRQERIESLLALRDLHERYGHIQEVIVQNFRAKPNTKMAGSSEPSMQELLWTVAVARLVFGPGMSIQAPPNLYAGDRADLIEAGINDFGGISPVTPDHVNPEAPWPEIEKLAEDTARIGYELIERLTVYPQYIERRWDWIDRGLHSRALALSDSGGFARTGRWAAGGTQEPDEIDRRSVRRKHSHDVSKSVERSLDAARRERVLSEEAITELFSVRGADFQAVCAAADELRRDAVGDAVTYVINRNINYTNVCLYKCGFCAFSKGRAHEDLRGLPYRLDAAELRRRVCEAWDRGATEVCMQGGIHPAFTGQTYLEILRSAKEAVPSMHVHAFSPLEIFHGATSLGLDTKAYLRALQSEGLGSLPGTAAEILDDEVRRQICPDKLTTQQWLRVIGEAHEIGLRTTATILFGHVEHYRHWARHLLRLRELQAATGGFTEFVPLPFVHMEAPMFLRGRARKGPTLREVVLMHAVSRLVFNGLIRNIQVSWVKLGPRNVQLCLEAGANDLGGTLMNESISRAAGAAHGQELDAEAMFELVTLCKDRHVRQRTTLYGSVDEERQLAALTAPPLLPVINTPLRRGA